MNIKSRPECLKISYACRDLDMADFHKEMEVRSIKRSTWGRCCAEKEEHVRVPTEGFCLQKMF